MKPTGQREAVLAEAGLVRVLLDLPGVVLRAEEAGVLAGPGQRAFHQERRQHHAAGDAVGPRTDVVQARGVARIVVARGDLVEERARLGVAGQELVRGVEVVRLVVRHATGRSASWSVRVARRGRCSQTTMPGHVRGDRLELAADALGGVGLHVERVEVAQPAGQEDQDHRLRPGLAPRRRRRPPSAAPSKLTPAKAEKPTWRNSRRTTPSRCRCSPNVGPPQSIEWTRMSHAPRTLSIAQTLAPGNSQRGRAEWPVSIRRMICAS